MKSDATQENTHVRDDLKAFCDGELRPWQRLAVRRHLARCASCREEVQAMQQLHRDLQATSEANASLPPALRTRILAQLSSEAAQASPPAEPARPWLVRYGFAASLAVNAALIVVLVYTGLLREHRSDQPTPLAVPVASPQPAPLIQNGPKSVRGVSGPPGGVPNAKIHAPVPSTPKPAAPMIRAIVPAPLANNGLAPMPVTPAPPAPKMSTSQKAQTQPLSAGATAPLTYEVAPPAVAPRRASDAANSSKRARSQTPPTPSAPAVSDAPAAPAPPPAAFGGGGFGGNSFGGGGFGGGGAPPMREAIPGGSAPVAVGRAASPPPAQALPPPVQAPALGGIERSVMADSNGAAVAKPAPSSAKTTIEDRAAPTPVGSWPTVTLPFGVEPSALGVKSVAVTWDVDEQGRPSHVQFKTTGNAQVDGALRAAVYAGQYQPAVHHGKPVKASLSHTFTLTTSAPP